jgi:hypothetical protein
MMPVRATLTALVVGVSGLAAPPAAARVSVYAALVSVSCPAVADCFAAGSYIPGGRGQAFRPLIERFTGSAWSVMPVPAPRAGYTQLSGVSCASATDCVAVGAQTTRARGTLAFAEIWNGSRWSISRPAVPPQTTRSELSAVSCAVSGTCLAVGFDNPSGREIAVNLAERWDGTGWTVVLSAPQPQLPTSLIGVSCVTATDCIAGGWTGARSPAATMFPLLKRWDGTGWQTMPSPHPAKLNDSNVIGVSCPPGAGLGCLGVGDYFTRSPDFYQYDLAERWNGRRWSGAARPGRGVDTGTAFGGLLHHPGRLHGRR